MYRKPLETDECPKPEELEAHAAKRLIGKRNEEVFLHLKHCSRCLRRISKLTRAPSPQESLKSNGQRAEPSHEPCRANRPPAAPGG